jgi:hypothetical protein
LVLLILGKSLSGAFGSINIGGGELSLIIGFGSVIIGLSLFIGGSKFFGISERFSVIDISGGSGSLFLFSNHFLPARISAVSLFP